ncbi:glycosyl hydrolase family 31 [Chitinophaga niastensis]|uniref:Glycosyl hydrolase family 31 n=1 Tax=Chitinophaga niastensis TaxID=536980 RepID=A0A2P8HH13_CHINA|nr:TIM-barrel domain-containing protein [Chitinophaga niastensis]PSL45502.1 glycosyl hydrolase family 31 [Chitinophaga niastensis]
MRKISLHFMAMGTMLVVLLTTATFSAEAQYRLRFNGASNFVELDGKDLPPPYTVECLVSRNKVSTYSSLLTGDDYESGIRLEQYNNTNKIGLSKKGKFDVLFDYELPVGKLTHLALVADSAHTSLYIDGKFIQRIDKSISLPLTQIGLDADGFGTLNATVDEMRMWDKMLSPETIARLAFKGVNDKDPEYAHLLHYYTFDEGSGSVVTDHKGTLHGKIFLATYEKVYPLDIAITNVVAPLNGKDKFSTKEPVTIRVTNLGTQPVTEAVQLQYTLGYGAPAKTITVPFNANPLPPYAIRDVLLETANLESKGIWPLDVKAILKGDENTANNTFATHLLLKKVPLTNIKKVTQVPGKLQFALGNAFVQLQWVASDIYRVQVSADGKFEDAMKNGIVVWNGDQPVKYQLKDKNTYYEVTTDKVTLHINKAPFRIAMYDKTGKKVMEETEPISLGEQATEALHRGDKDYFYGGGMQNGNFSHRDSIVNIRNNFGNWGTNTTSNPAPFFVSTAGYGIFRNTFNKGTYGFKDTVLLQHEGYEYDAYYFYGPSIKSVLEQYTHVTGRPFMVPRWGLEFGDADCYNKKGVTGDVIKKIAEKYREENMPGGWILPNDGYGCGYQGLDTVVTRLHQLGFYTGLWTENGVQKIKEEVSQFGTRCMKLDVAWVGPGYKWGLDGSRAAYNGIEQNADARGFIWCVAGWAGTQRYSTIWSGDQSGNWEYIRFHIPSVIGSGLSGFNYATGDVDGIFRGSAKTYVRDMQWKCFTPVFMSISGWAKTGKQPWAQGEPYTSINRKYMQLKMRLTPYMYSYCREAYENGTPVCRAMVLEYPNDTTTWGQSTQYQFLSGEYLLVAPVYKDEEKRDSIYLPAGKWMDYDNGTAYTGNQWLNNFAAPLEKLPLFVKEGAIIPKYPAMLYDAQKPKDTLTLEIYPGTDGHFKLYEDDGATLAYKKDNAFAYTNISSKTAANNITVQIGAAIGSYKGQLPSRSIKLEVYCTQKPQSVTLNGKPLPHWTYDPAYKKGCVFIDAGVADIRKGQQIIIKL